MKLITILFLTTILVACRPQQSPDFSKANSKKLLKFSLLNGSTLPVHDVTVGLHDTILHFTALKPNGRTAWIDLSSSYSYGYMKFMVDRDHVYTLQPIDFVGEKLYDQGFMTFIIKKIDTASEDVKTGFSTEKE